MRTRQRHLDEISQSLGLAHVLPPTSGVIVATGDPHGRINVSTLQFQFRGFIDLTDRGELFDQCLDSANRIIERYRMAKHDFQVRKVAKSDILFYGARHVLDGQVYNDCYDPVAPVMLTNAPRFPCDAFLRDALWFRYARPTRTLGASPCGSSPLLGCWRASPGSRNLFHGTRLSLEAVEWEEP